MQPKHMTTSAALYYVAEPNKAVSLRWFEKAVDFLGELKLSPILFTASGGGFEPDDCYVLADQGNVGMFEEVIAARRRDLIHAVRAGTIHSLSLDSPRSGAEDRADYVCKISIWSAFDTSNISLDDSLIFDPTAVLRRAHGIAQGSLDVRYGIAYKMPLADVPGLYATGGRRTSFANFQDRLRQEREDTLRLPDPNNLWRQELHDKRRHLAGLFRGAYPASILSEMHVQSADLRSQTIGKLTEIDDSRWLWELSDAEIPQAEAMLEAKHLLVRQS